MTDITIQTSADGIVLTDGAAAKVKSLLESEGRDDLALRVAVQPGGCSGLRYQLFFPVAVLVVITVSFYIIGNAFADDTQRFGAVAAPRVIDDEPRCVLRQHRLGRHDVLKVLEELPLHVELLDDRFDHEVAPLE